MLKKQRKWLNKYAHVDMNDLPDHLYHKLRYYKMSQPVILLLAFAWLYWFNMAFMIVGVIFMCIFFMLKVFFEPTLDKHLAMHMETRNGTPAQRAKARYLSLPEGHPDAEKALQLYLTLEAKEKEAHSKHPGKK